MARAKRYTAKGLKKRLQGGGWVIAPEGRGKGSHICMVKEGKRPVTIPVFKGQTLPVGLSQDILKQAEIEDD